MTKYILQCPHCNAPCYYSYAPAPYTFSALLYMDGRPVKPKDQLICESCKAHMTLPKDKEDA